MDTRSDLLTHAERFIRTRGYDAFSFGDLAEAVGIRKASVHYHFPTKADLATALIQAHYQHHEKRLEQIDQTYQTGSEQIGAYCDLFREETLKGQALGLTVACIISYDSFDPEVHGLIDAFQRLNLEWLEEVYSLAKDDGTIKAIGPAREAAEAAFALLIGAQVVARGARSETAFDEATALMRRRLSAD